MCERFDLAVELIWLFKHWDVTAAVETTRRVPGITRARYSPWRMSYIFGSVPKNTRVGKSIFGKAGSEFTVVWW